MSANDTLKIEKIMKELGCSWEDAVLVLAGRKILKKASKIMKKIGL